MVGVATHTVSAASSAMWAETALRRQFDCSIRANGMRTKAQGGGRVTLGREGNRRVVEKDFCAAHLRRADNERRDRTVNPEQAMWGECIEGTGNPQEQGAAALIS